MNAQRSGGMTGDDPRRVFAGSLAKRAAASSLVLALAFVAPGSVPAFPGEEKGGGAEVAEERRVALSEASSRTEPDGSTKLPPRFDATSALESPSARAIRTMLDCRARFETVKDYTCTFYKRERINGKLSAMQVMSMKMRNDPHSVYLRFHQPNKGREAIFVEGRNGGNILAHDVGFTKLLAGTMKLDPNGSRAMEECRHPITKAGIAKLIETVIERWTAELDDEESVVLFDPKVRLGSAPCLLIEAIHPEKRPGFMFHKVRLFVNAELGFPVRYEAYDWPEKSGDAPELLEEYAYDDVKLNVGLGEDDFDAGNKLYSFGRF